jgi:hypothetical protein
MNNKLSLHPKDPCRTQRYGKFASPTSTPVIYAAP